MNVSSFLEHWGLSENPFRDEEALHDAVFARLWAEGEVSGPEHPDFAKVLGDLKAPSSSVVFGEKGSGKTAIKMQLSGRVSEHNRRSGTGKVFLVPYDEWNPVLDRFASRTGVDPSGDEREIAKGLSRFALVDHMDAILAEVVTGVCDELVRSPSRLENTVRLTEGDVKALRRAPLETRKDLLLLASLYDRAVVAAERTGRVRAALKVSVGPARWGWRLGLFLGWLPAAGAVGLFVWQDAAFGTGFWWVVGLLAAAWAAVIGKVTVWDRFVESRVAGRASRVLRTAPRGSAELAAGFAALPQSVLKSSLVPRTDHEETRYALFGKLRGIVGSMGYSSVLVLVDRVDEPALIRGDVERMRVVVWPLMNSKFLQMPGFAVKMLLPSELRHELFRESSGFFRSARLDKQNLIERLSWTGATLYDLCNARLRACREGDRAEGELSLVDVFGDEVDRRDLVDALDQMHQPRDAFKLMYQCIAEHCANVTEEEGAWRIPRSTLDVVRKRQSERVQDFYRGIRPA